MDALRTRGLRRCRIPLFCAAALLIAACGGGASEEPGTQSSDTTGAPDAAGLIASDGSPIPAELLADVLTAIEDLRADREPAASDGEPLPPLDVDDWFAALPWDEWEADFDPARVADDIYRATLEYLIERPTRDGSAGSALVTAVPVALRQGEPSLPAGWDVDKGGETTETFDQATALVRQEMHNSFEATQEGTGTAVQAEIDTVFEWYACWDPGQPEQRSARLELSNVTVTTIEGRESIASVRATVAVTEYVGGGFTFEFRREFRYDESGIAGSITASSGDNPDGEPFDGDPTVTETEDGNEAQAEYPGGGSATITCTVGPSAPCVEEARRDFQHLPALLRLLLDKFDEDPGGDTFCLVAEVDPATATLAPGGDVVDVTLRLNNWNDEPIEDAEVTARLSNQLGFLVPMEGGTDPEGAFRTTYTTDEAGEERARFDFKYSFYEWFDAAVLKIQRPWKLRMTLTRHVDGDQVVWSYDGVFGPDADGQLVGSGTGGINGRGHCVSEDYSGPFFELVGTFSFEIEGSLTDEVFDLEVTGSNASVRWLQTPSDPICGEAFFDLVLDFVGTFAEFPLHQLVDEREIRVAAENGAGIVLQITDLGTLRVEVFEDADLNP